ncbi:MAG TPA: SDR family NAD(P)-dependent oxidoreductase [Acidimicrobiales bacterium]|nr:SDR family NAD(P)-dependent oxidoreductase [Acidimicrobiales bacterium]
MRFDGRTVVVTGGGRGLGREYALLVGALGARVVVNDLGCAVDGSGGSAHAAESTVEEINSGGGLAMTNSDDVSTQHGAHNLISQTLEEFGQIDAVINNAGILTTAPMAELTEGDFQRQFQTHLFGTFNVTRAAWAELTAHSGNVVNIVSHSVLGHRSMLAYSSAKGALIGFTRSLAEEGRRVDVAVNGFLPTAGTRMAGTGSTSERARDWFEERLTPDQCAATVAFLAHHECPLRGELLTAGGGRVARVFIAETRGIVMPGATPDDIDENLNQITEEADYYVFASLDAAMRELRDVLQSET